MSFVYTSFGSLWPGPFYDPSKWVPNGVFEGQIQGPDPGSGVRPRVELQNPDPFNALDASNGPILKLNPITRAREGI